MFWCFGLSVVGVLVGIFVVLVGKLGVLVGILGVLIGVLSILVGKLGILVDLLIVLVGAFFIRMAYLVSLAFRWCIFEMRRSILYLGRCTWYFHHKKCEDLC